MMTSRPNGLVTVAAMRWSWAEHSWVHDGVRVEGFPDPGQQLGAGRAELGFEEPCFQPADAVVVRDGSACVGTASHGRIPGGKVSRFRVVVVAAPDQEREVERRA